MTTARHPHAVAFAIHRRGPAVAVVAAASIVAAVGLGACIRVPSSPAPMCHSNNDCDRAHGEVCEAGVCWGDPPPGAFAAIVSPPSTRHDLVSREIPEVTIPDFGWMGDLALEAPVQLNGRVVAFCPPSSNSCDPTALGATITVSRRSQFQGGPGFQAVVDAVAGADSFSMSLPRTGDGDDPYTVTVVPDDVSLGSRPAPATQLPPLRTQLAIADNLSAKPFALGGTALPVISGTLTDSLGNGLASYRVAALGRWDPTEAETTVSSIATTDASGNYAVTLSADLVGTVELVARPPDGSVASTLHLTNLDAGSSSAGNSIAEPINLGNPATLSIQVTGADLSGTISPVPGAQVVVSGGFARSLTSFTMTAQQVTDDTGTVTLQLLDGAGFAASYRLSIIPPAGSMLGVVFDQAISLTPATVTRRLVSRTALRGEVVGTSGKPLGNVTVTARPSLRFLWALDTAPQAFVGAIPTATTVTPDTGEFVLWVDPNVDQIWGSYDLVLEPASEGQAPSFIESDVAIPRDSMLDTVSLGSVALPEAAYVHGRITGPDGTAVDNAELKLYLVSTELSLCSEVAHAPTSCPIPAQLLGRNSSDDTGTVRLALPR